MKYILKIKEIFFKLLESLRCLKLKIKLPLLFIMALSIFAAVFALGINTINEVKVGSKLYNRIKFHYKSLGNLVVIKSNLSQIDFDIRALVDEPDLEKKKQIMAKIIPLKDKIQLAFKNNFTHSKKVDQRIYAPQVQKTGLEFITFIEEELFSGIELVTDESFRETVLSSHRKKYERLNEYIDVLIFTMASETGVIEESVRKSIRAHYRHFIYLSGILFAVLFTTLFFFGKKIIAQLTKLVAFVQNIAQGDFSETLEKDSRDEIGEIIEKLGTMNEYLSEMVKTAESIAKGDLRKIITPKSEKDILGHSFKNMIVYLRDMAITAEEIAEGNLSTINIALKSKDDFLGKSSLMMITGLRETISEINVGSKEIDAAADNIFASTTELSTMTAKQASIIADIAASISEIKETSEQSGALAEDVIAVSRNSTIVSEEGLSSVERTINGMEIIQQQVQIIRNKIGSLSSHTSEISEIISTVKDLAEQSNVLALNALIEAARAGEHGRGFAVVADEVKNLATQSKKATNEVSTILSNILKAKDTVENVVQEGSERTDEGVTLAREAGSSIKKLVQDIEKSSLTAMQIAASTKEQTIGIDQVSHAIDNINRAIQEIVDMIVHMEKSAGKLATLSKNLRNVINRYSL
ncbi:methyl-accepting chemotaxis protein [candidate division CSSED10-310 bacterium]|uniref:Methyl-accepting chemotaxis protein n=1 Tax=candidate division CSSED10-310 bacterium TaxID=2855610 RepID=A0ABV6YSA5_UNCC1